MSDARLIQLFLSDNSSTPGPGIFEVSETDSGKYLCNCPGFEIRHSCKHTKYVDYMAKLNGGVYEVEILSSASKEEAVEAVKNAALFRQFLLKYGKIVVV